jgi:hypothetical protein
MTLPPDGTIVTAVPAGLKEARAQAGARIVDVSIPTMEGAPDMVTGPLTTRHVVVPEVHIDYVKCTVQGWDVDPATITEAVSPPGSHGEAPKDAKAAHP